MRSLAVRLRDVPCPLCGVDRSREFLRSDDLEHATGTDFRLVRCLECGHVYLNPAPTPETLHLCYPAGYGPHRVDESADGRDSDRTQTGRSSPEIGTVWYLRAPVRSLPGLRRLYHWLIDNRSQELPPVDPSGRSALELGCATGQFLEVLRERGWRAGGIDLVEAPVRVARGRGFDVHRGEFRDAGFAPESVDDVFAWMVIEHLPDPAETVNEIFRVMRPGGWFCFSVPNFASPERRLFGKHWKGYELPRHLQHFTPSRLRELLTAAGFEQVRLIHQSDSLYWIGSLASWLDPPTASRRAGGLRGRVGAGLWRWYRDNPPLGLQLLLAPVAKFQAWLRLSGKLTVIARKPLP